MNRKRNVIIISAVLMFCFVGVVRGGGAEWFVIDGGGELLGSVAYPDGGFVDVTLNAGKLRFTSVSASGERSRAAFMTVCSEIDSATVTANGRFVHLITSGESCNVDHWRYRIPDEMVGLDGRYSTLRR